MSTSEDIAWAAGLFEGEGCITTTTCHGRTTPRLLLNMTDEDTVRRFQEIVATGKIYRRKVPDKHKQPHIWQVGKKKDCEHLLLLFYPRLSVRRKQRADEILEICRMGGRHIDGRLLAYDGTPIKLQQKETICA